MIRYIPIETPASWTDADCADLLSFDWRTSTAKFIFCERETPTSVAKKWDQILVVTFDAAEVIVRMLDEFPLSTESDPQDWDGLAPHHFAYLVEGDPFFTAQSSAWRSLAPNLKHYLFMTGNGCLDVITSATPRFGILDADRDTDGASDALSIKSRI
ncbi:hypothetical protein [Sphingorhabdus contaminans]|uniref:hypothetical protein n=1 Tax=Sphingorhabdus contaminans TaxID=1343899 RepID=UPI003D27FB1C